MAKSIPAVVKEEVLQIISAFNEEHHTMYQCSFRGKYAYLVRYAKEDVSIRNAFLQAIANKMGTVAKQIKEEDASMVETKIGRLQYNGQMDNWSFAVFKYSNERYDPDVFFFPGAEELDGTITGALRAGLLIYD